MIAADTLQESSVSNDLSFLWLEITGKCNLFCSHCYADSGPNVGHGDMSYHNWTNLLDEAAELGCRSVQFIGGEPTMHPQLDDLIGHAGGRGFEFIEVFTNATSLGNELLGCFRRNRVRVATSFYSDDPDVHEQITHGKGSWKRTIHGIENVLAAGLPIRVGVIETDKNIGHAPRATSFLRNMGVQQIRVDRQRGVGRAEVVRLGADTERYEELCGQCSNGKLCVTSSGEVFPCVFSRATRLGNAKSGLTQILQSAKLTNFRRKVRDMHSADPTAQCPPQCGPYSCDPYQNPDSYCGPCSPCGPSTPCTPTCSPPCNPDGNCGPS